MMRRSRAGLVVLLAVAATIGCDRVTKHFATTALADTPGRSYLADTIWLQYAENTGGFLGMGSDLPEAARTALFTVGTGLMLAALVAAALHYRWRGWLLVGAALVAAGGVSNWADRLVRGSVVDFITIGIGPLQTGVFNVADVAIMLGVGMLMIAERRARRRISESGPEETVSERA